jgi:hypothetical protein
MGTIVLILGVILPVRRKQKKIEQFEDWPEAKCSAKTHATQIIDP